jgi:alpha-beta hydrolase superfamily lysophospholipase
LATLGGFVAHDWSVIMPTFKVPNFIDPQALSNNTTNIEAFNSDPYAVNKVSICWLREFTLARTTVLNQAQQITIPVLINHGEADTIASLSGAKALFDTLGAQDKTFHSYPGLKHELLNHCPDERASVLLQTFAWLKKQCETIAAGKK